MPPKIYIKRRSQSAVRGAPKASGSKGKQKTSPSVKKEAPSKKAVFARSRSKAGSVSKPRPTEFELKFDTIKDEKIRQLADQIEPLLRIPERERAQVALEEAKNYWADKIALAKGTGQAKNSSISHVLLKPTDDTLRKIASQLAVKVQREYDQISSFTSPSPLTMVKTEGGLTGPPDADVTGFIEPDTITQYGFQALSLGLPSSFGTIGEFGTPLRDTSMSVSRHPPPPLAIGDPFDQPAFASSSSSSSGVSAPLSPSVAATPLGGAGGFGRYYQPRLDDLRDAIVDLRGAIAHDDLRDAITDLRTTIAPRPVSRNITTGAGGGGERAMMPREGLDVEFPAHSMIGNVLDKYMKPSLHALVAAQTPNVYQTEMIKDGKTLRDHTNPPKRSEYLDKALWGQPKDPDNATPHQWFKICDTYSNPAKLGTISCYDKYTLKDPSINLTGVFGNPFGTDFDDRWTQGTNPFSRTDRDSYAPGTYQDFMVNFLSSNGVG